MQKELTVKNKDSGNWLKLEMNDEGARPFINFVDDKGNVLGSAGKTHLRKIYGFIENALEETPTSTRTRNVASRRETPKAATPIRRRRRVSKAA